MSIPSVGGRDIADLLAPQGAHRQPMDGFDTDYSDIVDYILRCTHRIWEQKDLGLIETHYAKDCPIHLMTGPIFGMSGVVSGTARTLGGFPDRTLYGEAVIWSGDDQQGYLSSHRIISHASNIGPSELGPATGKPIVFTTIADCLCRQNLIVEEWLVRDNGSIAHQLGFAPRAIAKAQAMQDIAATAVRADWRLQQIDIIRHTPATPFPDNAPPSNAQDFVHWFFDTIWNHRRFHYIRSVFAANARQQLPSLRRSFGWGEIIGWYTSMIGSFGDAKLVVDHVAVVPIENGEDIAVRWRLAGKHDGSALYGEATAQDVLILAVTHWRRQDGLILDEITIFDDIALLRQIEGGL